MRCPSARSPARIIIMVLAGLPVERRLLSSQSAAQERFAVFRLRVLFLAGLLRRLVAVVAGLTSPVAITAAADEADDAALSLRSTGPPAAVHASHPPLRARTLVKPFWSSVCATRALVPSLGQVQ